MNPATTATSGTLVLTLTDTDGNLLDRVEVPREEFDAEVKTHPHGTLAQLQAGE